jgi:hypothetical protein
MDVVRAQQRELAMSFSAIIFFMVLSSTVIYFLEHEAQPHRFPDIPATMWWAVLTMTTVGENFYPITTLGKLAGGLIIILGVATFALPTSILTSGFVDELERRREEKEAAAKERRKNGPFNDAGKNLNAKPLSIKADNEAGSQDTHLRHSGAGR